MDASNFASGKVLMQDERPRRARKWAAIKGDGYVESNSLPLCIPKLEPQECGAQCTK